MGTVLFGTGFAKNVCGHFSGAKPARKRRSAPGRQAPLRGLRVLGRAKLALRNEDGGLASPPYHLGLSLKLIFRAALKNALQGIES